MGEITGEGCSGPLAWKAGPPRVVSKGSGPRHPMPRGAPGALSCFVLSIFVFTNTLQVQSCSLSQGEEGTAGSLGSGPTSSSGRCSASLSPRSLRCVYLHLPSTPHRGLAQKGPFATGLRGPAGESTLCHPGSSYSFLPVATWHWPQDLAFPMTASVPPPESPWNQADPQPHFPLGSLKPLHPECQDMPITLAVRPRTFS